jgi:hypothetical protein
VALTRWGFIYTAAGSSLDGTTTRQDTGACRTALVGIPEPEYVVDVAKRLVSDGVQLIELCGGFGPIWAGKVIEAIDGAVPVGTVAYGPEAIDQVRRRLPSCTAAQIRRSSGAPTSCEVAQHRPDR